VHLDAIVEPFEHAGQLVEPAQERGGGELCQQVALGERGERPADPEARVQRLR
jgi:hypothetical protein